jgi:hypothetical protein
VAAGHHRVGDAGQANVLAARHPYALAVGRAVSIGLVAVTGMVVADVEETRGFASGFGSGEHIGRLVLHELGHVLGLGHTSNRDQVMFAGLDELPGELGAGDRAGLAALADAGCEELPLPPW